jgi:hypothetical protein
MIRATRLAIGALAGALTIPALADRPTILLTGYWPPTNEMVRQFSADPEQNPDGWVGSDWEGRGYDVYAYFPEFSPPDCSFCGRGMGDLEVDYQDTSADFWPIADGLAPVAVITFSRGANNFSWELERNQYNRPEASWVSDYDAPFKPTPSPPDDSVPVWHKRLSTLPVKDIVDAVNDAALGIDAFVCFTGAGGGFLSEFIAYHGVWYQSIHEDPSDPAHCVTAGHVHVGQMISWDVAEEATEITLRTVIDHVDTLLVVPGDVNGDRVVDSEDLILLLASWGECPKGCPADFNDDGVVDTEDLLTLLSNWT